MSIKPKVRAITAFITLDKDKSTWEGLIKNSISQCLKMRDALEAKDYQVQSIRLVTNSFEDYLRTDSLKNTLEDMEDFADLVKHSQPEDTRIRVAIGEIRNPEIIGFAPEIIKKYGDIANICVNVGASPNGVCDSRKIGESVKAIEEISKCTHKGEGNFNFTVNFNCPEFIPYFPASYHNGSDSTKIALGFEYTDLLLESLENLDNPSSDLDQAFEAMSSVTQTEIDKVLKIVGELNLNFIGIDSSAAPSKDCPSVMDLYEKLGVKTFGEAGTIEISALLTRVFKSIKGVDLVGFSGLMLAVLEDLGLARDTRSSTLNVQSLLINSTVCGIGLDTVPIPGDFSKEKMISVMKDTGTLAYRLNKPLTVRLFPVIGKKAGEITEFDSDDLCNAGVVEI